MDRVLRQKRRRTTCALYIQSSKLDELIGPLPEEAAAEKAAAEKRARHVWQLSDREKELVKNLGTH